MKLRNCDMKHQRIHKYILTFYQYLYINICAPLSFSLNIFFNTLLIHIFLSADF